MNGIRGAVMGAVGGCSFSAACVCLIVILADRATGRALDPILGRAFVTLALVFVAWLSWTLWLEHERLTVQEGDSE